MLFSRYLDKHLSKALEHEVIVFFSQLSPFPGLGADVIEPSPSLGTLGWGHAGMMFHGVLDVLSIVYLELDREVGGV